MSFPRRFSPIVILQSMILCVSALSFAAPSTAVSLPSPFFFTENKGQWDSRVLFKCQAKNGMTWFLERDGITLLVSREQGTGVREQWSGNGEQGKDAAVRQTLLSDDPFERDLPEVLRKHPQRKYPMKSHALKFKFLKGDGSWVMGSSEEKGSFPNTQHLTPNTVIAEAQSIEANGELPWKNNYFLGNDSSKWAPNCRNFSSVVYREVWEGIDIEWYENDGKLEFDFIVHPGFDPNQIRMSVEGLNGELSLAGDGFWGMGSGKKIQSVNPTPNTQSPTPTKYVRALLHDSRTTGGNSFRTPSPESRATAPYSPFPVPELLLPTSLGELRTALPSVYQVSANGSRTEIEASFQLTDKNTFGIILPNGHNVENTLRIDPLIYSTFLGGSDDDYGMGIVGDGSGGVFITGGTGSTDFPVTAGVGQTFLSGSDDCFVTHLNSAGSDLLYSTYLGGSGFDNGYGITSDESGGVIVTGGTHSGNFPRTAGSYHGGTDCFVSRLNSTGSQLIFSVLLGGSADDSSRGDDFGRALVSDGNGGAFVTGSATSSNFTTTTGSYDTSFNGTTNSNYGDCFVAHLSNSGEVFYSTYLGGSGCEEGYGICKNDSGGAIVTGWTSSNDFPITTGVYDTSYNGGVGFGDCFVTHLSSSGSQLIYSTFLGGSGDDRGACIFSESNGEVIVSGHTNSQNFPTSTGAYDTSYNGGNDCFVAHLINTGSQLFYSTFLGGSGSDGVLSFCSDEDGGVILTGATSSDSFPTTNNADDRSYSGGAYDCFVAHLSSSGSQLIYSTYLGGSGYDVASGVVYDGMNSIVLTGRTTGSDFPTTLGAFDTSYNGGTSYGDCFVALLRFDSTDVTHEKEVLPLDYSLTQNYPNPFNASTTISYSLPKPGTIELKLFDITGREVTTLVDRKQQTGSYRVTFDGKNLSSGTYFVRMKAGEFVKTQKMVLLR